MTGSPLGYQQTVRARTMVLALFFAHIGGLCAGPLVVVVIASACWWLAMLPLGRGYRWWMAGTVVAYLAGCLLGVLATSDSSRETTFGIETATVTGFLAGPLLLSQAMLLLSGRTGLPASEASWRRARSSMLVTAFVLIGGTLLAHSLGFREASTEGVGADLGAPTMLFIFASAGIAFLLFMLALFETQREIHGVLFRPVWRRAGR